MFIRINPYLCHLLTRYQSTIFPNHKSCVRKKGVPFRCSLLYLLAYLMSYDTLIGEMVLSKSDSISGLARMGAVTYTIGMITDTYFIGVGLGSHRCFSFLTNLMSAVGFIGFFLFFYFVWALVKPVLDKDSRKYASIVIFGLVLFVAQCVAIPDFSFPIMWMWIYLSVILHFKYRYDCS